MDRKRTYRLLLGLVLILAFFYTLGLFGVVSFRVSYYITIFMLVLFVLLRIEYHSRG
ncbi:hypothetical protein [Thermococcus sp.]|uniref:hypothetical protein n=1 Tax=Thermococcus sp. TaxID=35749 RepID=UPI0025E5C2CC|nr:hypothetical protein [Thermococcus sp.]